MQHNISIGLVEDQVLFREGIKHILESHPGFQVTFESENGFSVIGRFESESLPDVLLVDLSLPPDGQRPYNGLDLTKDLKVQFPEIGILILSVHDDPYFISELIEHGANGYLVKDSSPDEVYEAITTVHNKGSYINARTLQAIQGRLSGKTKPQEVGGELSKREVEVLKLVCQQMTTEEIANTLFISPKTVNGHRNNLLQKTGSRNVTGLVMYAIKHHIVEVI